MPDLINTNASISGLLALQIYDICPNKYEKNFMRGLIDFSDNNNHVDKINFDKYPGMFIPINNRTELSHNYAFDSVTKTPTQNYTFV